jgi:hypothetical protein
MMDAKTQQRVHQIVSFGNGIEMSKNPLRLFILRHFSVTEISCFIRTLDVLRSILSEIFIKPFFSFHQYLAVRLYALKLGFFGHLNKGPFKYQAISPESFIKKNL